MSVAWHTLETRLVKAERRTRKTADESLPPGAISVLLYGVAVHLGDFPTPAHPQSILEADDVFIAVDRALGYSDAVERDRTCVERDEEWVHRFAAAVDKLREHLGLCTTNLSFHLEVTLLAFIQMLDDIAALELSWGSPPGLHSARPWYGVDDDMDTWIGAAGFSPEALRRKARGV